MGNGVKQGGKLSPLLFKVYMDNLSVQLHTKSWDNGGQSPDLRR